MGTLSKLAPIAAVVLSAASSHAVGQGNPSRPFARIRFARGGHGKVVSGRVGGESIDTWLLRARKGQRVQVDVLRGLAELQQPGVRRPEADVPFPVGGRREGIGRPQVRADGEEPPRVPLPLPGYGALSVPLVTGDQLRAIMPGVPDADTWADCLVPAAERFSVTTGPRLAAFLAQLAAESGEFRHLVEDLDYSAARLCQVWPRRFPTLASAEPFAHRPEGLANRVYSGRLGNGGPASGDGWRFRGRGLVQTTGRGNYLDTGRAIGADLVADPDLLAHDKHTAALAAAYFWQSRGLNVLADGDDEDDFERIT